LRPFLVVQAFAWRVDFSTFRMFPRVMIRSSSPFPPCLLYWSQFFREPVYPHWSQSSSSSCFPYSRSSFHGRPPRLFLRCLLYSFLPLLSGLVFTPARSPELFYPLSWSHVCHFWSGTFRVLPSPGAFLFSPLGHFIFPQLFWPRLQPL